MLVHIKDILQKADREGYAVGAFNTQNLELTLAIARAAVAQKSPVIIQISEKTIEYAGLKPITHIVETIAKNHSNHVPIALHLDHGKSFLVVSECVKAGFSSIHIDGCELPYDENVALTKESVAYAHRHRVWAQGELGTIFGKEGLTKVRARQSPTAHLTDPARVREYVEATRVDTLAVSVGTFHGSFKGREHIDQRRVVAIHRAVKLPLVLHGGSGVSLQEIKLAIRRGIRVINVDTDLRIAFTQSLRRALGGLRGRYDLRGYLGPATVATQRVAEQKMVAFGSAGKVKLSAR